jgi:hypothetical protein
MGTKATGSGAPPEREEASPIAALSGLGPPVYPGLSAREQEIAAVVYAKTAAAASELEAALADLPAPEVQSLLRDLVAKGVLDSTDGRNGAPILSPALRLVEMQTQALAGLAVDYFEGSLEKAVRLMILLLHKRQPEAIDSVAFYLKSIVER